MNKKFWLLTSILMIFAMILAACAPAATPAPTTAPAAAPTKAPAAAPTTAPAAPAASEATINVATDATLGKILVDGKGMVLYMFTKDEPDKSNCSGGCIKAWPPLLTQGKPTLGPGVDAAMVGSASMADGTKIVTYNKMPLYYYAKDTKPGETTGQGVGSVWYVVAPDGKPVGMTAAAPTTAPATGEVYYLNFKPEVAEVYSKIADAYKKETGNTLKVVTAAAGTYEQTLKSEIAKSDAPTLFQINGPIGYKSWKDYTADMKDTELYKHLSDKNLAVTDAGGVYGVPYAVEGYGIIYNNAIFDKYFATDGAKAKSMAEINNFATLKAVVEDMTAKKDKLGIKGVFCATSLKPGEDWRWQTHLMNVPVFYEWRDNKIDLAAAGANDFKFQYSDNFKNIFDLYLNNSTTSPKLLGSKSVDDSMAEFALGQCAMVQNGNWAWGQINGVKGNTVKPEDVKFLPIYTGMPGEEKQSVNIGTENFFSINKQASPEKQKLAADFIWWLYSSPTGKAFVTNDLKFIAPFDTFADNEKPTDPLAKSLLSYAANKDLFNVAWNFVKFPGQTWKNDYGAALLQYAQGKMKWEDVVKLAVTEWPAQYGK